MSVTAAQLKNAYDALDALSTPVHWAQALQQSSGELIPPSDAEYYVVSRDADVSFRDNDGTAFTTTRLVLMSWASTAGAEDALLTAAITALEAEGWEYQSSLQAPSDAGGYGLTAFFEKMH